MVPIKIGGDGRVIEILKKRNCTFDLKRLFDVIALVQDHLKSGVQQACWDINDHICFCLLRIALLKDLACVQTSFRSIRPQDQSPRAQGSCDEEAFYIILIYFVFPTNPGHTRTYRINFPGLIYGSHKGQRSLEVLVDSFSF